MRRIEINELLRFCHQIDISRGINYYEEYKKYYGKRIRDGRTFQIYEVESERTYDKYLVKIELVGNRICDTSCGCIKYEETRSCKHIAAVLLKRYDEIMQMSLTEEEISENILSLFYKQKDKKHTLKKELKLDITLVFENRHNETILTPKIKIGTDKLYGFNSFGYSKLY